MIIHLERPKKYATQTTQTSEDVQAAQPDPVAEATPIVLVIHGGAGGTIPPDMSPEMDAAYRARMRVALSRGYEMLSSGHSALDAVCRAVVELENDPLFNAARGAVFDRAGQNQCEASVMVAGPPLASSSGVLPDVQIENPQGESEKVQERSTTIPASRRTAAVTLVRHTKNPILLARALYLHPSCAENVLFSGEEAEKLGWQLGCEKVDRDYYWTRRRWLEHRRDLGLPDDEDAAHQAGDADGETIPPPYVSRQDASTGDLSEWPVHSASTDEDTTSPSTTADEAGEGDLKTDRKANPSLDLPKGTVGAVALDSFGRLACATSTGGKTNKFPGRIGDTPSVGAGYWAEVWQADVAESAASPPASTSTATHKWSFFSCLYGGNSADDEGVAMTDKSTSPSTAQRKAGVAISGTGDGDYFQRTSFASLVAHRMRLLGESADDASREALAELTTVGGKGTGGAIILDAQGRVSFPLNSATMNRGVISSDTGAIPRVAIYATERCE